MFLMFRILQLVDNGSLILDQVQYVVMDEADEIIDDGRQFVEFSKKILKNLIF